MENAYRLIEESKFIQDFAVYSAVIFVVTLFMVIISLRHSSINTLGCLHEFSTRLYSTFKVSELVKG